jgi:autotransporter-associated beta strand protein
VVGTIDLSAGTHPIEVAYYEGTGGYVMSVQGELDPDQSTPPTSLPNPTDPANNGVNSFLPSPLDLQYSADSSVFGLQFNTPITNTTQLYGNAVSVTSNSNINVTGSLAATMGDLTINGSTLGLASDDASGSPYSLTLGFTTLTGNATFNVANSAGGGAGTLVLGPVSDLGNGFGITVSGGGTLELAATNTFSGPTNVNSGRLLIDAGASIQSTAITVGMGGTLQLAGTTHALPSAANITTKGSGLATDGAVTLTGSTAESIGTITGDASTVDGATVYAGNTTVGDGTNAASLTATQILQNTLTISANSTVTIAPSAGAGGAVVAVASSASADSSSASADSSGGSGSDPFTAIQDAIAAGSISSVKGQQLENRIAAIEQLATTDPGLDVSLLESRVLAALPSSSILPSNNSSPSGDIGASLLAVDSSTFASGSEGVIAAFAPDAAVVGSPAAVPEPSTILLLILGGIATLPIARLKFRQ